MQELKAGSLLQGGKYRIVTMLGQGGFGITYQAMMKSLVSGNLGGLDIEVPVAVKEFFLKDMCVRHPDSSYVSVPSTGSKEQMQRYREKFVKEARNISALSHPHIVKVVDVFEENGTVYYAMEFLPGGSLRDRMKKSPLPEQEALTYIRQIADALAYMHQQKHLCHYDVKPGNILVDQEGNAKLIDFGISKSYDKHGNETSTTPVGLSPGYAPFEQYQNSLHDFSPQSDIYSLGATLLALLTGEAPPEAPQVIENGIGERPAYISMNTWQAISKSMVTLRKERPQTIAEFLDILDNGLPVSEETVVVEEPAEEPEVTHTRVVVEQQPDTPTQPKPIQEEVPKQPEPIRREVPKPFPRKDNNILKYVFIVVGVAVVVFAAIFLFRGKKDSLHPTAIVDSITVNDKNQKPIIEEKKTTSTKTAPQKQASSKAKQPVESSSQNKKNTSASSTNKASNPSSTSSKPSSNEQIKKSSTINKITGKSYSSSQSKKDAVDDLFNSKPNTNKSSKQKAVDNLFE